MKRNAPSMDKRQAIETLLQGIQEGNGQDMLSQLVRLSTEQVLQMLLEQEQGETLGRTRYERTGQARGYRNGYEEAKLKTAEGVLSLKRPQVRGLNEPYQSKVWEGLEPSSSSLHKLITEMYVRGMSTRDIEEALEQATGSFVVSDSSVSRITDVLYAQYEAFRSRDLSGLDVAYVFVDAVYEPLRRWGSSLSVLCAWGMLTDGRKVLLHVQSGSSEREEACLDVLRSMASRGLRAPMSVTSDGALGWKKAIEQVWPKSVRIRCWVHTMRNLQAKVPKDRWQEFRDAVCLVRDASSEAEAYAQRTVLLQRYETDFPEACRSLLDDGQAKFAHLRVLAKHRVYVRTTNLVERCFVEERRRSKTIPHLWDEASAVKLVFASLIRVSERWQKRRIFSEFEQQQVIGMRAKLLHEAQDDSPPRTTIPRRSAGHVAA